jgi:ribose transport system substrate-binding protein
MKEDGSKMQVNCRYLKFSFLILCLGSLGSCVSSNRSGYTITLVTKALDSEFWAQVKLGAEEAARQHTDIQLSVLAPAREIDVDQQVNILEDQILKRVSGLAVVPGGAQEIVPVLDKAHAAGIPVVIVDTDVSWSPKISYVGTDNRYGGRLAGEFIVKALHAKGKVALVTGIPGVRSIDDRQEGCLEILKATPGIEIVSQQPANSERSLALTVMENILTSQPEINAVFASSDQMALGAIEAIEARGKTGKIVVVGFDAGQEALQSIQRGRIQAAVAQRPFLMGKLGVEAAYKAAKGELVEKRIDTGTELVTAENVGKYLSK